jgi:MerR family transcriptional regulator, light-induced transcriptional regulator
LAETLTNLWECCFEFLLSSNNNMKSKKSTQNLCLLRYSQTQIQLIMHCMSISNSVLQPPTLQQNQVLPTFRSGVVARLAGMPVATLRIWEQRYQAVRPTTSASGQRLYSEADVERTTLLRQLTAQGYGIGLLAVLETEQLRDMISAANRSMLPNQRDTGSQTRVRVVVIGQGLALRLQRLANRQPSSAALQAVAVFDTLAEAAEAAESFNNVTVDLLLWQASSLQSGVLQELLTTKHALRAAAVAVVYRFSSAVGRAELTGAGIDIVNEPSDDNSLSQWLASLQTERAPQAIAATDLALIVSKGGTQQPVLPPRFDDAALTQFAGLSTAVACECPSHLAELLLQVSSFEKYSRDCANRSAADAQLHIYLQQVAGSARMLFEKALERVAVAEGLPLPCASIFE